MLRLMQTHPPPADLSMPEATTMPKGTGISTLLTHAGETPRVDGAAVTPIFQSATFLIEQGKEVRYTRCHNNPSQQVPSSSFSAQHNTLKRNICSNGMCMLSMQVVAAKLAALEGAEAALVFSSGMAAISSTLMSLLQSGDHLLIQVRPWGQKGNRHMQICRWTGQRQLASINAAAAVAMSCSTHAYTILAEVRMCPAIHIL